MLEVIRLEILQLVLVLVIDLDVDFMLLNISDEAGVNSSMTDVFGVAATGLELIPPRQFMTRIRYSF